MEFGSTLEVPAVLLALCATLLAVLVNVRQVWKHLENYTEPTYQRHIVRIIFMVPVYAAMSFCALVLRADAIWFNTIRDVYEAFVIYNFLCLCLAWVGGPGAVVVSLSGQYLKPSLFFCTCCVPPIPLDGQFIRRCKQGCLQFVFLKPLLAAACLVLEYHGLYQEGSFSPKRGYLYVTLANMVSYTAAVYALFAFYLGCKDLLRPFNPILKFLMIKSVVVLTYWQGVAIFLVAKAGWVEGDASAADLQNFLICLEMALAAVGFCYAFPHRQYEGARVRGDHWEGSIPRNIGHVIDFHDVVDDTMHQFAPTYHDYILYSDGGGQEGAQRYRTRTFVPRGQESGTLRKHQKVFGGGQSITGSAEPPQVSPSRSPTAGNDPGPPSPFSRIATPQQPGAALGSVRLESPGESFRQELGAPPGAAPYDPSLLPPPVAQPLAPGTVLQLQAVIRKEGSGEKRSASGPGSLSRKTSSSEEDAKEQSGQARSTPKRLASHFTVVDLDTGQAAKTPPSGAK